MRVRPSPTGTHQCHRATPIGGRMMLTVNSVPPVPYTGIYGTIEAVRGPRRSGPSRLPRKPSVSRARPIRRSRARAAARLPAVGAIRTPAPSTLRRHHRPASAPAMVTPAGSPGMGTGEMIRSRSPGPSRTTSTGSCPSSSCRTIAPRTRPLSTKNTNFTWCGVGSADEAPAPISRHVPAIVWVSRISLPSADYGTEFSHRRTLNRSSTEDGGTSPGPGGLPTDRPPTHPGEIIREMYSFSDASKLMGGDAMVPRAVMVITDDVDSACDAKRRRQPFLVTGWNI